MSKLAKSRVPNHFLTLCSADAFAVVSASSSAGSVGVGVALASAAVAALVGWLVVDGMDGTGVLSLGRSQLSNHMRERMANCQE